MAAAVAWPFGIVARAAIMAGATEGGRLAECGAAVTTVCLTQACMLELKARGWASEVAGVWLGCGLWLGTTCTTVCC